MSSRIIISVLLGLVGSLGLSAAPIDPAQKNPTFQPGAKSTVSNAKIVKPAASAKWNRPSTWSTAKVQKISPAMQAAASVDVNGFTFHHVQQAKSVTAVPANAQPAGGSR